MKHKVEDLRGALLDAAVAMAEGLDLGTEWNQGYEHGGGARARFAPDQPYFDFAPSTNWSQGGPIVERERIALDNNARHGGSLWSAQLVSITGDRYLSHSAHGNTPLSAAMRVYVISRFGAEIDL